MRYIVTSLIAVAALTGCTGDGPMRDCIYLDCGQPRRNLQQSGVDDVQIPLQTRIEYARAHNLPPPRE